MEFTNCSDEELTVKYPVRRSSFLQSRVFEEASGDCGIVISICAGLELVSSEVIRYAYLSASALGIIRMVRVKTEYVSLSTIEVADRMLATSQGGSPKLRHRCMFSSELKCRRWLDQYYQMQLKRQLGPTHPTDMQFEIKQTGSPDRRSLL